MVLITLFLFPPPSQFTEEKLGQAEKTELDAHLENLLARGDCTKNWTEKILRQTEVLLQPNPSKNLLTTVHVRTTQFINPCHIGWLYGSEQPYYLPALYV